MTVKEFMDKNNVQLTLEYAYKSIPNWDTEGKLHDHYIFTITTPLGFMINRFWDSYYNTQKVIREDPSVEDIFSCLIFYPPDDFDNFCAEYGYNNDSIWALTLFYNCQNMWLDIKRIFTEDQIEELMSLEDI